MSEGLGAVAHGSTWRVLLIGGSSGTGKTVMAHRLARHFGVAVTQVDDIRLALQRAIPPAEQPSLHFFRTRTDVWRRPPEELRDRLIEVARIVSHAIEAIIAHHLSTPYPLILEGDAILPALAVQTSMLGLDANGVRSVFLAEPDEDGLLSNMLERGRGFDREQDDVQRIQARMNWLYAEWLAREARQLGLPLLSTRPRDDLFERILAAIR